MNSKIEEEGDPFPAKNLAKANLYPDHQDPPAKAGGNSFGGSLVASSIATSFS